MLSGENEKYAGLRSNVRSPRIHRVAFCREGVGGPVSVAELTNNHTKIYSFAAAAWDARCNGNTTENVVPLPTALVTSMRPW